MKLQKFIKKSGIFDLKTVKFQARSVSFDSHCAGADMQNVMITYLPCKFVKEQTNIDFTKFTIFNALIVQLSFQ